MHPIESAHLNPEPKRIFVAGYGRKRHLEIFRIDCFQEPLGSQFLYLFFWLHLLK